MNKKLISICALIAMAALVIAGASMAYFSDTVKTNENVLTAGNVDISIGESVAAGADTDIKPGITVERELKITGIGESGAYVRIKTESVDSVYSFSVDVSDTDWVDSGNGIYTYTKVLAKNESVNLTVSMTLNRDIDYDETTDSYVLGEKTYTKDELLRAYTITAEAIQTAGFSSYEDSFKALDN